jgi:enoyl-CoA hydratase
MKLSVESIANLEKVLATCGIAGIDAIVIEEKLFGSCFETEDQKAGMGNFLEKDKEKKLKVVPFANK